MTASCMLLSRVSSWRWLERTAGETLFDAAGRFIDGAGDAADFVLGSFEDAGLEIAVGDASRRR